VRIKIRFSIR